MHAVQFEIGKKIIRNKGTKLWNDLPGRSSDPVHVLLVFSCSPKQQGPDFHKNLRKNLGKT